MPPHTRCDAANKCQILEGQDGALTFIYVAV